MVGHIIFSRGESGKNTRKDGRTENTEKQEGKKDDQQSQSLHYNTSARQPIPCSTVMRQDVFDALGFWRDKEKTT